MSLLVLIIIFAKVNSLVRDSQKSYRPDGLLESTVHANWDKAAPLTIIIKAESLYLLSYKPSSQSLLLIKIPDKIYLKLPFGFGNWLASSIYSLGQTEDPPIGARLMKETVSSTFGIPVNGYLLLGDHVLKTDLSEVLGKQRSDPFVYWKIIQNSRTDLSLADLANLYLKIRGVRFDKYTFTDLGQSDLTDLRVLADGSKVLSLNPVSLDKFISEEFTDEKLSLDSLNVGILNSTDHPQMAERASRLINNLGGRVVFTSNLSNNQAESLVLGKDSYTKTRLSGIFAPKCLYFLCQYIGDNVNFSRADVILILGEDYYLKFNRSE